MRWVIWAGLLPGCLAAAAAIVGRPARQVWEEMHADRARLLFRRRREWLEARFVSALLRIDPAEGRRWEEVEWSDAVVWARDRQTRGFLALTGVHFRPQPPEGPSDARHATALFEYRKGAWHAEGKRLDEIGPDEAFHRLRRFERVASPHPPRA